MDGLVLQTSRRIRPRVVACGIVFAALLGVVLLRAVQCHFSKKYRLEDRARSQTLRETEIHSRRGEIVDRAGRSLATSVDEVSVYVSPGGIRQAENDADRLGKSYDFPAEDVAAALHVNPALVQDAADGSARKLIKPTASPGEIAALRKLGVLNRGIELETKYRRFYPNMRLASHLLGSVDFEGHGVSGVEKSEEELLSGETQAVQAIRDARGTLLPVGDLQKALEVPAGARVQLTIDEEIQEATEKALAQHMAHSHALAAMAIVMDPHTGAILALANLPDYNPNKPSGTEGMRDRAVTDSYEPGSVMKCFLVAGALSDGVVTPETPIDVKGGELKLGRRTIHDHDEHEPGHPNVETVSQVIAKSSNVGAARIGLKLGANRLVHWFQAFGFGERTNIDLPAEAHGVLQSPAHMGDIATATTAFGQGMTASGVQVVTALSTIANGGQLMRPYLVQKIVQPDGTVLIDRQPQIVRHVLSQDVVSQLKDIMVGVVNPKGTGPKAAIDGIEVAGKTGTAQKVDPRTHTYGRKHFASFMGFAPANDPRIAVYVAFDAPEKDTFGGEVAAPAFQEIAMSALLHLRVLPSTATPAPAQLASMKTPAANDDTEGLDDGSDALEDDSGDDDAVAVAGADATVVPDVHGCSARAGLRLLHGRSLEVDLQGSGRVLSQRPEAGRTVPRGTHVHLTLGAG